MSERSVELASLLDTSPFPALVVDDEYCITDCNRRWVEVVNASTRDGVLGMSALEFLPEKERATSKKRLESVIGDGEPVNEREYLLETITGTHKTATGSISPVYERDSAFIVLKNISRVPENEVEAERRRRQIEELHDVSTKISAASTKEEVSEHIVTAMENVVGLDRCLVGLVKDGVFKLGAEVNFSEDDYHEVPVGSEEVNITSKAYQNQQVVNISDVDNHPDAKIDINFESVLTVPMGEFGIVQSTSNQKRAFDETDAELVTIIASHGREALNRIEREKELEKRKEDLEALKSVYSRVFRHNFRNQANITQGRSEVIISQSDNPTVVDAAETILKSTGRLIAHSEKARKIKTIIDSFDEQVTVGLEQSVSRALSQIQKEYPQAEISVAVDDGIRIQAHPHVETAIINAIENAILHNEAGVTVDVYSDVPDTGSVVSLVIEDTGDGIPEDEIEALERDDESDLAHSSGVGLWVIKFVTRASEGEVQMTNTGDGARVEIEFPLADQ